MITVIPDTSPLDPIAEAILRGRAFAEAVDTLHRTAFDEIPITPITRAQAMRSAVQAQVIQGSVDGFTLEDEYLWSGRVEVVRVKSRRHYLLKARSALPFEISSQRSLLEEIESPPGTKPLLLLLYEFGGGSLDLATAPSEKVKLNGRVRYRLLGDVSDVGTWAPENIPGLDPFDQGSSDDFGDLSEDVDLLGEDEEAQ